MDEDIAWRKGEGVGVCVGDTDNVDGRFVTRRLEWSTTKGEKDMIEESRKVEEW